MKPRFFKLTVALGVILVFLLAGVLPAFATPGKEQPAAGAKPQTVTFLISSAKRPDSLKSMADKLLQDAQITLELQVVPDAQYSNVLQTRIATGEPPDMIMVNVPQNYGLVDAQNNCVDLGSEPWVSRLVAPQMVKASDGKTYAMPLEAASGFTGMYYNKAVLRSLGLGEPNPKTYADFLALLGQIKAGGVVPIFIGNKDTWVQQIFTSCGLMILMGDKGPSVMDKIRTNKLKFADVPEYLQILTMLKGLYDKGYVNKDNLTTSYDDSLEAVGTGKAAMTINGEWVVGTLESKSAEVGVFAVPYGDKNLIATGQFVQGFLVFKNGKNRDAAKQVLRAWSNPEYMDLYFAANPGLAGLKGVNGGKLNPSLKAFMDYYILNRYVYEMNDYLGPGTQVLGKFFNDYVDMVAGNMTPQKVVTDVDAIYSDYMKSTKQPGW